MADKEEWLAELGRRVDMYHHLNERLSILEKQVSTHTRCWERASERHTSDKLAALLDHLGLIVEEGRWVVRKKEIND